MKKIMVIVAILTICLVSVAVVASATVNVTWGGDTVSARYSYYSEFTAPSKYCQSNGETYDAHAIVTFPSGKESSFDKILLDEIGNYSITYIADVEGTVVQSDPFVFEVKASPADMWNTHVMLNAYNNADVPSFNDGGAVLLSAHDRLETKYASPIYIGDNTQNDDLMTFVVVPKNINYADFESFCIIVEDYYNANNRLYIRFTRGCHEILDEMYNTSITVSTDGKTFLGKDGKQYNFQTNPLASAYVIKGSGFYGQVKDGVPSMPISVNLDPRQKTVKVSCANSLTFDLTDEFVVGEGNAWKGIDSGLVNIYVGFLERTTSAAASVAIYSVDGISMGGNEVSATKEPVVVIDDSKYSGKVIAKKGVKHKFLDATALDSIEGELESSISVYRVKEDILEKVSSSYDGFIPAEAGKYYVEFTTETNSMGKQGTAGYYLEVLEPEDCEIEFTFGSMVDSVKAGNAIVIPEHTAEGVGPVDVVYSAKIGNTAVEIVDGKIIPEYAGELVITATCTDLAQTMMFDYDITVLENNEIYFNLGYIPSAILIGDTLDLSNAFAFKYSENGRENLDITITYDGNVITEGKITPTSSQVGTKQIVVSAEGTVKTFDVVIKEVGSATGMIADYFGLTSGSLSAESASLQVITSEDTAISFLREIDKNFFFIQFGAPSENANFTHLTFTLYDSLDSNNVISFDVLNSADATLGEYSELVYNGQTYKIYGNFRDAYGQIKFDIRYDSKTNSIVDHMNNTIAKLSHNTNGDLFNGFKGNIRFSIDVCGVTAESKLNLFELCSQVLKKGVTNTKFNIGPEILFQDEFSFGVKGVEYVIPSFMMYDVLNSCSDLTITIKDASGAVVYTSNDDKALKFTPETSGNYSLIIEVLDNLGNKTIYTNTIIVTEKGNDGFIVGGVIVPAETYKPTLTINAIPTKKVNVGETFNIAKITATDNSTPDNEIKLYAYVIAPNGVRTLLCSTPVKISVSDDLSADTKYAMFTDPNATSISCTPTNAGRYMIYYVARDNDGLTTIEHYAVEVVNNNG